MADKNAKAYSKERYYAYCHNGKGDGVYMFIGPNYDWVDTFDKALLTSDQQTAVGLVSLFKPPMPFVCVGKVHIVVDPDVNSIIVVEKPQNSAENT